MPHLETGNGHQVNKNKAAGSGAWSGQMGSRQEEMPRGSLEKMALSSPDQVGREGVDCFVTNWHH